MDLIKARHPGLTFTSGGMLARSTSYSGNGLTITQAFPSLSFDGGAMGR
jgi:hypothetical protein